MLTKVIAPTSMGKVRWCQKPKIRWFGWEGFLPQLERWSWLPQMQIPCFLIFSEAGKKTTQLWTKGREANVKISRKNNGQLCIQEMVTVTLFTQTHLFCTWHILTVSNYNWACLLRVSCISFSENCGHILCLLFYFVCFFLLICRNYLSGKWGLRYIGCQHFFQFAIVFCMGVSVTDLVPQTNLYQVLSKIINDDPKPPQWLR